MANNLTIEQSYTFLNEVVAQATGQKGLATLETGNFVNVGQTALKAGYDPLMNAISQVLSRTIFAVRPYDRKFRGLSVDNETYGNMTRKISYVDDEFEEDKRLPLADGTSIDPWVIRKKKLVQENFYGQQMFSTSTTVYRDQLDTALHSADEFGRLISGIMQTVSDEIEQGHEDYARALIGNVIASRIYYAGLTTPVAPESVVHLLTEYNAATGLSLTPANVQHPDNFPAFAKWAYARIATIAARLTERTEKYHVNITGKPVRRHTPYSKQRLYTYAPARYNIDARVLADTFHDNYLKYAETESVNFWQSFDEPMKIDATPKVIDADGNVVDATNIKQDNVFGVLMDVDAAGYTTVNSWSAPSPFNPRGGYTTMYWHFTDKAWMSFLENAVVLLMD